MRPLVYVAGPISSDPWGCVRRAVDVARQLHAEGIDSYLPQLSVLHEIVDPQPYEHWIDFGLNMVGRCDGIYRLPGESPGADREVERARQLDIPAFTPENGIEDIYRWATDESEWMRHDDTRGLFWWLDAVRAQAVYRSES